MKHLWLAYWTLKTCSIGFVAVISTRPKFCSDGIANGFADWHRFLEDHPRVDWASVSIRDFEFGNGVDGYFGAVSSSGDLQLTRLLPGVGAASIVQAVASGFDALDEDLRMRLVADGSSIDLFAWPATDSMPLEPQLVDRGRQLFCRFVYCSRKHFIHTRWQRIAGRLSLRPNRACPRVKYGNACIGWLHRLGVAASGLRATSIPFGLLI